MSKLDLTKLPILPRDAGTYASMCGVERLAIRVELASERRLDLPSGFAAITLLLTGITVMFVVWAVPPLIRTEFATTLLIGTGAACAVVAATGLFLSARDGARRFRAWSEIFSYIDTQHPAPSFDVNPPKKGCGWRWL